MGSTQIYFFILSTLFIIAIIQLSKVLRILGAMHVHMFKGREIPESKFIKKCINCKCGSEEE